MVKRINKTKIQKDTIIILHKKAIQQEYMRFFTYISSHA